MKPTPTTPRPSSPDAGEALRKESVDSDTERDAEERTSDYVIDPGSGCWLWLKSRNRKGYGQTRRNGKSENAHRSYWRERHGDLGDQQLHHLCPNPHCVNPDHLELLSVKAHRMRHLRLSAEQVRSIRERYVRGANGRRTGNTQALAAEYGLSEWMIRRVVARKHYAWVT